MYLKIRKEGDQWFRIDDGTLVGTELSKNSARYKRLSKIIGEQILIKDSNNQEKLVCYGYLYNKKFVRINIPDKNLESNSHKDCGYYIFVRD